MLSTARNGGSLFRTVLTDIPLNNIVDLVGEKYTETEVDEDVGKGAVPATQPGEN